MLLGGLDAESRGLESLNPSGKNYDWWGCGNLEDSGPGTECFEDSESFRNFTLFPHTVTRRRRAVALSDATSLPV